jgi:DNA-binding PadR family transcriptional regulator
MGKGDFLGEFEQVVLLAVLRQEHEAYGMSIRREIEESVGRDVTIGAVYGTLDRLERKGLVRTCDGEPTPVRGGRARKHFAVTRDGAAALRTSRSMMNRLWEGVELGSAGEGG